MNNTDLDDFTLDVTLVDAGPAASGYATNTSDNCGSGNTGSNACTTKPDSGY
ncbi:FxLD family lanthipeptide [Cryptosporangium sp. NPDC051539]|uniref:FxLD family lanthipeptide n=1 Tax=Cryptosporangium sp. NPDC051539 TaxID=3363962 RepID=UPI0037B1C164